MADLNWRDALCTFPCKGKVPLIPFSLLGPGEKAFVPAGANTAIATGTRSGVVVIDCDDHEATEAFVRKYRPPITFMMKTPRGFHFYFQQPEGKLIKNSVSKLLFHVDVRGEGGLVVFEGEGREVFDAHDPAPMPPQLLADLEALGPAPRSTNTTAVQPIDPTTDEGHRRVMKAKDFLRDAPPAIEGENGSGALFNVALKLVRTLELDVDTAVDLIEQEYNWRCTPTWRHSEIVHKCEDARDRSDRPTGPAPEAFLDRPPKPRAPDEPLVAPPGKLRALELNEVMQTLTTHPAWEGVFRYDVMGRQMVAIHPPVALCMERGSVSNGDIAWVRCWFESEGGKVTVDTVMGAIEAICEDHPYNPFVEYLDALPNPGVCHLSSLHEEVLNSPDGPIASSIFAKQMVAAIRRSRALSGPHDVSTPIDHRVVVILDGEQETGKSSLLRQLAGPWYGSIHGDPHDKDTKMLCKGKVFIEMEEMATARRSDRDTLKAFISAVEDEYRKPYGRSVEKVARSFVLFGTSNDLVLPDPTGNTRFAVIRVGKMCGKARLMELRDALWWEANQLALDATFDHHLTEEEKAFCKSRNEDYEDDIVMVRMREALEGVPFVTLTEAYDMVTQSERKIMPTGIEQAQILSALRHVGCHHKRVGTKNGWLVPEALASMKMRPSVAQWLKNDVAASKVRERLIAKGSA